MTYFVNKTFSQIIVFLTLDLALADNESDKIS